MAKIPLTIDKNYCADWGVYQGIRELIQNAKDADEDGHPMTIEHFPRTGRLEITTKDVYVTPSKLLVLGKSDKTPGQKRGQFGEGFVLGCLALIRKGCDVSFRNGDASWSVSFEEPEPPHPLAGNELLTFKSRQLAAREADFCVEVENISKDVWEILAKLFLFVEPPPPADVFLVEGGRLLLGDAYAGKVFSRGIFVNTFKNLACGYDLDDLQLDRDRRFVDEWSLQWKLARLWKDALAKHPEIAVPRVYAMAKASSEEVKALSYHADQHILSAVRGRFHDEHGEDAVPVTSMADAKSIEEIGGKPTMVNDTLRELLKLSGLTADDAKRRLEGQITQRLVPSALTSDEQRSVARLCEVIPEFTLVEFAGKPACRLIDDDTKVGFDRRLLAQPFKQAVKALVAAEAQRRHVDAVDILLDYVAHEDAAGPTDSLYPSGDVTA